MRRIVPVLVVGLSVVFPIPAQQAPTLPKGIEAERDVEYGKAGDVSLKLDVYKPTAASEKPRPVVVWIHGGGWQGGNKDSGARVLAPVLVTGDYVGVSVGYRLTNVASWPAQIHDCKAAIRWVRKNASRLGADPERIAVWGGSAGGHLVSMLGTSGDVKELDGENGSAGVSSRVKCVVDFCGPSDFPAFAAESNTNKGALEAVRKLLGGTIEEKPDVAREASPITYVTRDDPPFLVVHGTADNVVPYSQAERFHTALQKAGVDSTFVSIEGGGHGIGGAEVNSRVRTFLAHHLLGKSEKASGGTIKVTPPRQ